MQIYRDMHVNSGCKFIVSELQMSLFGLFNQYIKMIKFAKYNKA